MYFQKQQSQESFMLQVENVDKETQVTHSNYIHLSYAARNAKRSKVKLSNVERASIGTVPLKIF